MGEKKYVNALWVNKHIYLRAVPGQARGDCSTFADANLNICCTIIAHR